MVARIEGSDPDAPSLCLMGHTDVVPVNPDGWRHDPFAGEVIDGEVWGRGAIDMLNLTSSMAVAFRRLATEGFRPKGDLIYFGVADEEAGGVWGAEWMAEHHWDAIDADYVLTELGGWSSVDPHGDRAVTINVGEKGLAWRRLRVGGTPGHGSMPFGSDNALVKAAEVVRRLAAYRPAAHIDDLWNAQVDAMELPDDVLAGLRSPDHIWETLEALPTAVARTCHAAHAHDVLAERGARRAEDEHDPRRGRHRPRHPHGARHERPRTSTRHLREALGELYDHVEVSVLQHSDPTRSEFGDGNPLWDTLTNAHPGGLSRGPSSFPG